VQAGGEAEGEGEGQANSELSVQPVVGLDPMTLGSGPELRAEA